MVKVKLLNARCGHSFDRNGRPCGEFAQAVGQVIEMPEDEAARHIERGLAVAVTPEEATK